MSNYVYFKIEPSTPAMKIIDDFDARQKAHTHASNKLALSIGIPKKFGIVTNHRTVMGWGSMSRENYIKETEAFIKTNEKTWRMAGGGRKGVKYAAPRHNTAEGKAVLAKIDALPKSPDSHEISNAFLGVTGGLTISAEFGGLCMLTCTVHRPKGFAPILGVPWANLRPAKPKKGKTNGLNPKATLPEGLTEMMSSAVFALIDAEDDGNEDFFG